MRYVVWFLLIGVVIARILLFYQSKPKFPDGTKLRIRGRISSEPVKYSDSQYFKLSGFKVYLSPYPEVFYGDDIVVEGKTEMEKLKDAKLVEVKENKTFLYEFRKKLVSFYQRSLPVDDGALVAGIAIGSKANIRQEFWEKLKSTGTAHVVVASGMNITLVAKFLITFLAFFFPRRWAIPFALSGVWGYAALTGFDAPIIRAAVMGSLAFSAQELGKISQALRTLIVSGLAMLFIKPDWVNDLGFVLSFAATGSLVLFEGRVRKFLAFAPKLIREDLSTSFAAQIGVAPILFFSFGQLNIFSPFINALVLWTIVPITLIGMVSGILGLFFEPFGTAVLLLSYPLTRWFIFVVSN